MLARPFALITATVLATLAHAQVSDFTFWTLAEDPPHPSFNATATTNDATLFTSGGPVPLNTDIGYQSVNGATPAAASSGFAFLPDEDFAVAIDYDVSSAGLALGVLSFGFGLGEDGAGANSAGVAFVTQNGAPFGPYGGAARQSDNDLDPIALPLTASAAGTLFVSYEAASGDVTFGAATTPNAPAPESSDTFPAVASGWNGEKLLVSFFMRSGPVLAWQTGNATGVFSNFRVLDGSPRFVAVACSFADITEAGRCIPGCPDGATDLSDFSCYLAKWAEQAPFADITTSGSCVPGTPDALVDLSDFACYLAEWANGCP